MQQMPRIHFIVVTTAGLSLGVGDSLPGHLSEFIHIHTNHPCTRRAKPLARCVATEVSQRWDKRRRSVTLRLSPDAPRVSRPQRTTSKTSTIPTPGTAGWLGSSSKGITNTV